MKTKDSLKEIERRAYRATFADGVYEIFWGCFFLFFAWVPILEQIGISRFYCYPLLIFIALIPWLGKKLITIPRLGMVEFGEKRKTRKRYAALIGIAVIILMLPLVILVVVRGFPGGLTWKTVALIGAPALAIGLFLMDFSRMYLYGLTLLFCIAASEFLGAYIGFTYSTFIMFAIPGAVILFYGFYLLVKFLKAYPKSSEEMSNVSQ